jgi:hypothetical protein
MNILPAELRTTSQALTWKIELSPAPLELRQNVYFCTSKAGKLCYIPTHLSHFFGPHRLTSTLTFFLPTTLHPSFDSSFPI